MAPEGAGHVNPRHVGTHLREARERRGLSVQKISVATRIPVHTLEALEAGTISKLPGGIFSRSFVRAYAAEVGLDPEEAVRDFVEEFPVESVTCGSPLVQEVVPEGTTLDPDFRPWPGLLVLGAFAAAGLIATTMVIMWWRGSVAASAAEEAPAPVSTAPAPPPLTTAPPPNLDARWPAAPAPAPVAVADGIRVSLTPDGPCWARVTADGSEVFEGLLDKGAVETHEAKQNLVLTVGDAAACKYTVNGRPGRVLGGSAQVVTVRMTPANVQTFWP